MAGLFSSILGTSRFEKYVDRRGEWRWRLISSNGNTIADSGEGYQNEADCLNGIRIVMETNEDTPVELGDAP
jgi:uncharacterized protein YegP (UPF0339 family)